MRFVQRLLGRREKEEEKIFRLTTPKGELTLKPEDFLEKDPDARIEEFWVDTMDVSEDGYWLLVGRRHGLLQLYDWRGKIHRLPSRPPAQVITDILFRGRYLALITPPYLVVYLLEDIKNPQTWKSFRTTQEGIRASVGLDLQGNLLAYGVVGERVYVIDISGGFGSEGLDFRSTFSYSEAQIGELRSLKFIGTGKLLLSGTRGVALYDLSGKLLRRLDHASGRAVLPLRDKLILAEGNNIYVYDPQLEGPLHSTTTPINISQIDLSPDGEFIFLADAEENRMGLVYLPNLEFLHGFEGFGYSVVRVSPDGSIYTCTYREEDDKRLYSLRAITTNLTDFIYNKDRQSQIIKRAEEELKALKNKLKRVSTLSDPQEFEEYRRLLSMDSPIRRLREVIFEAQTLIEEAKFNTFVKSLEDRIKEGKADAGDLRDLESRIKVEEGERVERLKALKESLETYFQKALQEHLERVRNAVSEVESSDLRDFEALEEVKRAREFINKLPSHLSQQAQAQLLKVFHEKLLQDRLSRYRIRFEDSRVIFGSEDFPKFSGERRRLKWRIRVEERLPLQDKIFARIAFEREDGVLVEPKRYPNLIPQEELKTLPLWVRRYLRHLNGLFSSEPSRLPLFVSYEETPWFVRNLERFASLVKEQLMYSEGILILEGDAGVGKNFLVEVFSALTNRPLYIIPCNSKMEKEDITFVYEFDPRRGTKRTYSDLVKALQTPGAVIYFDEINTLPAGMVKLFNPLFDYRRYLTLPTGEVIKAHREVVLIGGMNPQNYLGVSELPQDIKSRADIIFVDYPPFEDEKGIYHPDEAIILKDHVRELSFLTLEEFIYLWHSVVNGLKTEPLEGQERLEKSVWKVFELLKIANAIRKAYRAYQTQQSEEPVDFVFSIRDTIRCARRLDKYPSVKSLVLETILPKVGSPLEKEIIKSIVERL
ncbi:AAA family ATPase [Pampinifervens florentissimum]|uniref:AAA family ATPase n=1 Tax=Pampinifervens florentissimum TaxID=1632019 RepID=UPI0013B4A142|nr:AAA family ATPase [Hydrogenobacter sp. T-8]QID33725.1 AAA domain-containing protein [Hydrogenobacter sp. T-8]